jgi:hypothetical protein
MSGIALPRRELWLPRPMQFAKKFFRNPSTGAIYRNAGGGFIYDEQSELEDCCCGPVCDGTNAVRMEIVITGGIDELSQDVNVFNPCAAGLITYDVCRTFGTQLNGTYSTTDLYGNFGTGSHSDTIVSGLVTLGTDNDETDPGLGPIIEEYGYVCDGSDWVLDSVIKSYVWQLWGDLTCCDIGGGDHVFGLAADGPGGAVPYLVIQRFEYDADDNFVGQLTPDQARGIGLVDYDTYNPLPPNCGIFVENNLNTPFSKSEFSATATGLNSGTGDCGVPSDPAYLFGDAEITVRLLKS